MKNICILGSTGSIGTQTLDVIERQKDKFKITGLTANKNISLLENQIRKYKPLKAAVYDKDLYNDLKTSVNDTFTEVLCGEDGICEVASLNENDIVVSAIVGIAGLRPTLSAIMAKKTVALANKETMVTAGSLITSKAEENHVDILPVDSEHSAIFQCLHCNRERDAVNRIILTASGGPFFGKNEQELKDVTLEDALNHPNWVMGKKITIDSATLMNKGLELIEAKWLFDVPAETIDILVHRQSVIHSMVEFKDGAIMAQLGAADMRVPISVALNYPLREIRDNIEPFDFLKHSNLTFELPDTKTFKCLELAKQAIKKGGTMPAYLNGANEAAVSLFLDRKIKFSDIGDIIEESLKSHTVKDNYTLQDVFDSDFEAKNSVIKILGGKFNC